MRAQHVEQKVSFKLSLTFKRERNEKLVLRWIDIWRKRRNTFKFWSAWAKYAKEEGDEKRSQMFCRRFYEKGLLMRSIRHMKLFC